MITERKKLFPTPENCQRANDNEWPLLYMISYFQQLAGQLTEAQKSSAVVYGMKGVAIDFEREVPALELQQRKIERIRAVLQNGMRDGLTPDDIGALLLELG